MSLTPELVDRLEKAIEIFNKNRCYIILSGRYGFQQKIIPPITEAKAMAKYLREKGIPKDKLILEEKAKDTIGNAYFTKKDILEPKGFRSIIVITSNFHKPRVKYIFEKVFGNGYDIDFITVVSRGFDEEEEKKNFEKVKNWVKDIKSGDDDTIEKLLYTKHPGYRTESKN